MKRFASHYLHLHPYGFLKQYMVEINADGYVNNLFPLDEEIESITWLPGVILLKPECILERNALLESGSTIWDQELPINKDEIVRLKLIPFKLYPFDFTQMKPLPGTSAQAL